MTLAAVWIDRQGADSAQLCFASDSRTTPGPIEGVTKVMLFGRPDIAAVWAGDYRFASLLLAHLDAYFTSYSAMKNRDIDVARALGLAIHPLRRHLISSVSPAVPAFVQAAAAQTPGTTSVVVGGYSIRLAEFWVLRIVGGAHGWRVWTHPLEETRAIFIGDKTNGALQNARRIRSKRDPASTTWRMEPLAAIHRAIEDRNLDTIGGVPQLAKAFVHGAAMAYGLLDPISGLVTSRATAVDSRGSRELADANRLIDLSL